MSNYTIRVILDGQDNASDDFARVNQSMDQLKRKNQEVAQSGQQTQNVFQGMRGTLSGVQTAVMGMATAWGVFQAAHVVGDLRNIGDEAIKVENAFTRAAGGASEANNIMRQLTDTIKHVDDTTLQRTFTDFRDVLKLSNDEASGLIETVLKLNRYGEDSGTFFENTLSALKNQRTNQLDNLGINVGEFRDIRDALVDAGVSAADAFNQAFFQTARDAAEEFGGVADQNITAIDRLETKWENFVSNLGMNVAERLEHWAGILEPLLDAATESARLSDLPYNYQELVKRGTLTEREAAEMLSAIGFDTNEIIEPRASISAPPNQYPRGLNDQSVPMSTYWTVDRRLGALSENIGFTSFANSMHYALEDAVRNGMMSWSLNRESAMSSADLRLRGDSILASARQNYNSFSSLFGYPSGYGGFDYEGNPIVPTFDPSKNQMRRIAGQNAMSDAFYADLLDYQGQMQASQLVVEGILKNGGLRETDVEYYTGLRDALAEMNASAQQASGGITSVSEALKLIGTSDLFASNQTQLNSDIANMVMSGMDPESAQALQGVLNFTNIPNAQGQEYMTGEMIDVINQLASPELQAMAVNRVEEAARTLFGNGVQGGAFVSGIQNALGFTSGAGSPVTFAPGETYYGRFGYDHAGLQSFLDYNNIGNARQIQAGVEYMTPGGGLSPISETGFVIGDKSIGQYGEGGMFDTLVTDAQTAGEEAGTAIATGIGAGAAEAAGAVDTISAALAGLQGTYSVVVSVKYEVDPASDSGARAAAERQQQWQDRAFNTSNYQQGKGLGGPNPD